MKLSILMPVYNERTMVERCIAQVLAAPVPEEIEKELIVVDDQSTDGTWAILQRLAERHPEIKLFRHTLNMGKGAAVRTAIQKASGDFSIVQDADLEYDPAEYPRLLRPLLDGDADAVFGSRYLAGGRTRVLAFWHSMMNKGLTLISNMFCNLNLTDMETCYKAFRTDLLKSIPIRSDRFGFEPEIVMKCAKRKFRIYEVPISYHGRTYEEGKKISWRDGVKALGTILHFWVIDDLYVETYGRGILHTFTGTPRYIDWLTDVLRPHIGDTVLQVGARFGSIAARLIGRRLEYVAAEKDPLSVHALRNRFLRTPNVSVRRIDPGSAADFDGLERCFDTVLSLNVLEFQPDADTTVAALAGAVKPGGSLVILVPQGPGLFCGIDRALGHQRRFRASDIQHLAAGHGLVVERTHQLNKIGALSWKIYGGLLGRKQLSKLTLKLFDKTVWLWKRIDALLPWPGLSLIVIARKPA